MSDQNTLFISEDEHAELMRQSIHHGPVAAAFGPRGVRLLDRPDNQWAIEALRKMREARTLH